MDVREKMRQGLCIEPGCTLASAIGDEHCSDHHEIHQLLNRLRDAVEEARYRRRRLREVEKDAKRLRQRLRDLGVDGV